MPAKINLKIADKHSKPLGKNPPREKRSNPPGKNLLRKDEPQSIFYVVGVAEAGPVHNQDLLMHLRNGEGNILPIIIKLGSVVEFLQTFQGGFEKCVAEREKIWHAQRRSNSQ